jgi:hypothetical protein
MVDQMNEIVKQRGESTKTTIQTIKNDLDLIVVIIIYGWTL